jgi:Amt family ammonium transporter
MSATANAARIDALEATIATNQAELNTFYLMWAASLVFLMQAGFAMLSGGSIRSKNVKNILLKNILDACMGCICFYVVGYGIAYGGDNSFIGSGADNWLLNGLIDTGATHEHGYDWAGFFFQYAFAAAAATIVSGAVAERCQLGAYLIYTSIITSFIYPVVVHWVWDGAGFLSAFSSSPILGVGMIDFAGSGVVHMTGGWAAMMGAFVLGPRLGRWDSPKDFEGHSSPLQVIGTFLLWFGWYGFNSGSTLFIHGYARDAARAAVTTTISAASAGIAGLFFKKMLPDKLGGTGIFDLGHTCNSILGGLVSITAGCSVVTPYAAIIMGVIGALCYHGGSCLMRKLKIDDPLDAFAVHGACGFWGVVSVGLFATCDYAYSSAGPADCGLFYGGKGTLFVTQIIGVFIEIAWVTSTSALMFFILKAAKLLRVPPEMEIVGADVSKHGGSAYPEQLEAK